MKYKISCINDLTDLQIDFIKNNYPKRYEKALRYKFEDDFKRCILAYCVLIDLIGNFDEDLVFYNENNKPFIKGKPYFNISHSGDYVAVIADDNLVGIDIQKIEEKNVKLSKTFTAQEKAWIDEENSIERFHTLWAQKESAMKLIGRGLTIAFDKIIVENDKKISTPDGTFFNDIQILKEGYVLSLCYIN